MTRAMSQQYDFSQARKNPYARRLKGTKTNDPRQRSKNARPEALTALLRLASGLPGAWHTSASNIAMQPVIVRGAEIDWHVHLHAYAVRSHLTHPRKVEVTVGLTISADPLPLRHAPRARAKEWQLRIADRLAALGYGGSWGQSPDGPFAHFKKGLRSVSCVPAAIRRLQRVRF